ncbi:MAG TPA: Rrf2 family transcriptional regulator [Rhizomicrobium sp.]
MASLRFATAVHVMVLLAHEDASAPARAVTSGYLAQSIGANPVVVRRVVGALASAGLLETRAGAQGGAWLAREPRKIHLSDIYDAVEDGAPLGFRETADTECPVGRAAPQVICGIVRSIDAAARNSLAKTTLASVLKTVETASAERV